MLTDGGTDAVRRPYWPFSRAAGSSEHATKLSVPNLRIQHNFGRAAYEVDDTVAAGITSKLAFHSKNQCVLVSGTLNCVHSKSPSAQHFS